MRRILTSLLFVASLAGTASAADYSTGTAYHGWHPVPACDSFSVTWKISEKFAYQDARLIHSGLSISQLDGIHEKGTGDVWQSRITRRYCGATAWLSNGKKAEVVYVIEGPHLSAFSKGWHVESCVAGFDPFHVYDANCRSIRY
ncbi:MAG: hypothetical protein WDM94_07945 [Bauldia sp.]